MLRLLQQLTRQWIAHENTRSAAAIAYYGIFTIAPTLVFATFAAGQFVGKLAAQQASEARLAEVLGADGAELARNVLTSANFDEHGVVATVVSGILLLYGASAMFFQLRLSLNRIFEFEADSARHNLISLLIGRLLAAICVVVTGLLIVAAAIVDGLATAAGPWMQERTGIGYTTWNLLGNVVAVVVAAGAFTLLLRFLPARHPPLRHVVPGVIVAVLLFEFGKWLLSLYLSVSLIMSAYGPSSSLVAVVVWIYYSAQIFLLGAEVSKYSLDNRER